MNLKETFLNIKSYEEYDKRRNEFDELDVSDEEILSHLYALLGKSGIPNRINDGLMLEFTKDKPQK